MMIILSTNTNYMGDTYWIGSQTTERGRIVLLIINHFTIVCNDYNVTYLGTSVTKIEYDK